MRLSVIDIGLFLKISYCHVFVWIQQWFHDSSSTAAVCRWTLSVRLLIVRLSGSFFFLLKPSEPKWKRIKDLCFVFKDEHINPLTKWVHFVYRWLEIKILLRATGNFGQFTHRCNRYREICENSFFFIIIIHPVLLPAVYGVLRGEGFNHTRVFPVFSADVTPYYYYIIFMYFRRVLKRDVPPPVSQPCKSIIKMKKKKKKLPLLFVAVMAAAAADLLISDTWTASS